VVKDDKKDVYQDSVTAPLSRDHDDEAGGDTEGQEENIAGAEAFGEVLTAIPKVYFWRSFTRLSTNHCLYISAQKYHSSRAFKSPTTGGMARGSQCFPTENGGSAQYRPRTCSYYADPRCKDAVILYPPDAM